MAFNMRLIICHIPTYLSKVYLINLTLQRLTALPDVKTDP